MRLYIDSANSQSTYLGMFLVTYPYSKLIEELQPVDLKEWLEGMQVINELEWHTPEVCTGAHLRWACCLDNRSLERQLVGMESLPRRMCAHICPCYSIIFANSHIAALGYDVNLVVMTIHRNLYSTFVLEKSACPLSKFCFLQLQQW